MSACFTSQARMLRGALQSAFKLHNQIPKQPLCVSASQHTLTGTLETTDEYTFVERLVPPTRVPAPPRHDGPAPSGWTPPPHLPPPLTYMIRRSRMHNIPVYTDISNGNRRTTLVRKIEGDIWALNADVKEHLKHVTGVDLPTQVNEVTRSIRIKGHYDKEVKEWLLQKGF